VVPAFFIPVDDIRYKYDLAGGGLIDFGAYMCLFLRTIFAAEPAECLKAKPRLMPTKYDDRCDQAFTAKWKWPNGGIGELDIDLAVKLWEMKSPKAVVVHKEIGIEDESLGEGKEHITVKTVTMWNPMGPFFWHRIDILEQHTIRAKNDKKVIRAWETKESKKAYKWQDEGKKGEEWWTTYRYQLEAFVDKVKGRKGDGVWMEGVDSVNQMRMIDSAYEKAGMLIRPTSAYL